MVAPDGDRASSTVSRLKAWMSYRFLLRMVPRIRLVSTGREESMAAWAAKAEKLAWVTNRSGPYEIWIVLRMAQTGRL
jgi:hypothetical protein